MSRRDHQRDALTLATCSCFSSTVFSAPKACSVTAQRGGAPPAAAGPGSELSARSSAATEPAGMPSRNRRATSSHCAGPGVGTGVQVRGCGHTPGAAYVRGVHVHSQVAGPAASPGARWAAAAAAATDAARSTNVLSPSGCVCPSSGHATASTSTCKHHGLSSRSRATGSRPRACTYAGVRLRRPQQRI